MNGSAFSIFLRYLVVFCVGIVSGIYSLSAHLRTESQAYASRSEIQAEDESDRAWEAAVDSAGRNALRLRR